MLTSLKIISGDMRGRNGLKSKVSTLEELYDFFSEKILKNYIYDVIFGAVDIVSTGSQFISPISYIVIAKTASPAVSVRSILLPSVTVSIPLE